MPTDVTPEDPVGDTWVSSMGSRCVLVAQSTVNCKFCFKIWFPFGCIFGDQVVAMVVSPIRWIGV